MKKGKEGRRKGEREGRRDRKREVYMSKLVCLGICG